MKPKVLEVLVKSELQIEMCFEAQPIHQRKGSSVRIQKCDIHMNSIVSIYTTHQVMHCHNHKSTDDWMNLKGYTVSFFLSKSISLFTAIKSSFSIPCAPFPFPFPSHTVALNQGKDNHHKSSNHHITQFIIKTCKCIFQSDSERTSKVSYLSSWNLWNPRRKQTRSIIKCIIWRLFCLATVNNKHYIINRDTGFSNICSQHNLPHSIFRLVKY